MSIFLKDITRFYVRYREGLTTSPRSFLKSLGLSSKHPIKPFLELHGDSGSDFVELVDKIEERQTVIGSSVSELTMRVAGNLPIRYIYQDPNHGVYEDLGVLLEIAQQSEYSRSFELSSLGGYIS